MDVEITYRGDEHIGAPAPPSPTEVQGAQQYEALYDAANRGEPVDPQQILAATRQKLGAEANRAPLRLGNLFGIAEEDSLEPAVAPEEAGPQFEQTRAILAHSGVTLKPEGEAAFRALHAGLDPDLHRYVAPLALVVDLVRESDAAPIPYDQIFDHFDRAWGGSAADKWMYFDRAWACVPPWFQQSMIRDGLDRQPAVVNKLAEIGEEISDPKKAANLKRLLAASRAELARKGIPNTVLSEL